MFGDLAPVSSDSEGTVTHTYLNQPGFLHPESAKPAFAILELVPTTRGNRASVLVPGMRDSLLSTYQPQSTEAL